MMCEGLLIPVNEHGSLKISLNLMLLKRRTGNKLAAKMCFKVQRSFIVHYLSSF